MFDPRNSAGNRKSGDMGQDDSRKLDDDTELFRRVMDDAAPLPADKRAPHYKPKPPARARFRRQDEESVLMESLEADIDEIETGAGEALRFHRASVGRRTMRKLARGNFAVQGELDLHGMTVAEAKPALREFINESVYRGHSCVRVVHGKGLGSGERGPILKTKVNNWLRRWDEVLAFVSTRQVHGGTGAVYVLLEKG
jgi:DNA-nicking Smr family endonuclease